MVEKASKWTLSQDCFVKLPFPRLRINFDTQFKHCFTSKLHQKHVGIYILVLKHRLPSLGYYEFAFETSKRASNPVYLCVSECNETLEM